MMVSRGILTARGGLVSHAAVVARGWGTPAVVGADAIKIGDRQFTAADVVVHEGDIISLDNMRTAHARMPFKGERRIAVAMAGMTGA